MKDWNVNYSVKFIDGKVEERETIIPAKDIFLALDDAKITIRRPLLLQPDVSDVVIWDIGIMNDDVFEEVNKDEDD